MKQLVFLLSIIALTYSEPILLRKLQQELELVLKVGQSIPFTDCGTSDKSWAITALDLSPFPCQAGGVCSFSVTGDASQQFTVTKGVIDVIYSGVTIFEGNLDFKGTCNAGSCSLKLDYNLPSFIPPGTYDLELLFEDNASTKFGCVKFGITF